MRTFLTIWTKPTETFEYLVKKEKDDLDFYLNTLFFLGSLAMVLPGIVGTSTISDVFEFTYLILRLTVASFACLLIFKYFLVSLFWNIGKILQGKASRYEVRIVLAYSMIPSMISLSLSCILMIIANDMTVMSNMHQGSILLIWLVGAHILILGIAKFNKFTFGYTMINIFLAITLMQALALLLKYLIKH
jgi:CBS domain containing-hemolysin-like protein